MALLVGQTNPVTASGDCQSPPSAAAENESPADALSCYFQSSSTNGRRCPRRWAASPITPGLNQNLLALSSALGLNRPGGESGRNERRRPSRSLPSDSSSQFPQLSDWFSQADPSSSPAPQPSSDVAFLAFSLLDPRHVDRASPRLHTAPSWKAPLPKSRSFARQAQSSPE